MSAWFAEIEDIDGKLVRITDPDAEVYLDFHERSESGYLGPSTKQFFEDEKKKFGNEKYGQIIKLCQDRKRAMFEEKKRNAKIVINIEGKDIPLDDAEILEYCSFYDSFKAERKSLQMIMWTHMIFEKFRQLWHKF
jgi:hypothetical protein